MTNDMPSHKINIGNVELISLSDGNGDREPTFVFPDTTIEIWRSEFGELLDSEGHLHPRYGSLAVRSGGKLILVDTGLQAPGATLIDDMKAKGIDPGDIDLVLLTHLHPDHVGWNLTNGQPTFPNARYLAPRSDWEYWTQPSVLSKAEHIRQQVMPLEKLNIIDLMDNNYPVTDELTAISTPGHSPGHMSVIISSVGQRGYILGDLAHYPAQAHHTDWNPVFDMEPDRSRQTRQQVLDHLEAEGITVYATHFPDPGFGRFVRQGGRRVWQDI